MTEKQQQLTFDKGITNVPSDLTCPDGALEDAVGLVYENGEHRVIQKPVEFMADVPGRLLHVHRLPGDGLRYIIVSDDGEALRWGIMNDSGSYEDGGEVVALSDDVSLVSLTSIGNTLIVNTTDGLFYALWDSAIVQYRIIGNGIPEPELDLVLYYGAWAKDGDGNDYFSEYTVKNKGENVIDMKIADVLSNPTSQENWNNLCFGLYDACLADIKKKNAFSRPFFVRYALRMYDGSYMHISNPILVQPSAYTNCRWDSGLTDEITCKVGYGVLYYKQSTDYRDFRDLISGIDVFASDEVALIDVTKDAVINQRNAGYDGYGAEMREVAQPTDRMIFHGGGGYGYGYLPCREQSDIDDDLANTSVFYKIAELGISPSEHDFLDPLSIKPGVVSNLTTQMRLDYDDYYSRTPKTANIMKVYNNRLHLAGVRRGFFVGFTKFALIDNVADTDYRIQVYIKANNGVRVVETTFSSKEDIGTYFYYPDPRAYRADIYDDHAEELLYSLELKEHTGLNGAYFLGNPSLIKEPRRAAATNYAPESLDNKLLQSEVNNPFLFKSDGEVTVGLGKIQNIASQTVAMSQGQFGQFPLIAFCSDGIWALEMSNTGTYVTAHPFSREVIADGSGVTETDGAVFFSSEKGLMVVVGNDVRCVSEQLGGKNSGHNIGELSFSSYLKSAFLAYDYRDSLLWIFNVDSGFEEYCYVYSIRSGTFSKFYLDDVVVGSVVNDYPDYLLQCGERVYSLLGRRNMNADEGRYEARLVSRPLKLENGLALKSIMQMRHIYDMEGSVSVRIFASNNLSSWVELSSLRGTPWKYYRFEYDFHALAATDRFGGTVLVTQERRTDRLR